MAHGGVSGTPGLLFTNMVKRGQAQAKDPGWEVAPTADPETSVFTEPMANRPGVFIGTTMEFNHSVLEAPVWFEEDLDRGVLQLKFKFEDVNLQNVFSLQVSGVQFHGMVDFVVRRATSEVSSLGADFISDAMTMNIERYIFSDGFGSWRFRELGDPTKEHVLHLFTEVDNGRYTAEEFLILLVSRIKSKWEAKFPSFTVNVELFVNTDGRIELAWSGLGSLSGGGVTPDLYSVTSPLLKFLLGHLKFSTYKSSGVNYGTVVNGQSMVFMVKRDGGISSGLDVFPSNYPNVILISRELSQFQKEDSVTPFGGIGEIAVCRVPYNGNLFYNPDPNGQRGFLNTANVSEFDGSLFAPKIPFDPDYTLDTFYVTIECSPNNEVLKEFFNPAAGIAVHEKLLRIQQFKMTLFLKMW